MNRGHALATHRFREQPPPPAPQSGSRPPKLRRQLNREEQETGSGALAAIGLPALVVARRPLEQHPPLSAGLLSRNASTHTQCDVSPSNNGRRPVAFSQSARQEAHLKLETAISQWSHRLIGKSRRPQKAHKLLILLCTRQNAPPVCRGPHTAILAHRNRQIGASGSPGSRNNKNAN